MTIQIKKCLLIFQILLFTLPSSIILGGDGKTPADPIKILFIGNSYTFSNQSPEKPQLPEKIKEICLAGKNPVYLQFDQVLKGGDSLKGHWNRGLAQEKIKSAKWDLVVLQDHSNMALKDSAQLKEYVLKFDSIIKKTGAKTLLYMTWAKANLPETIEQISKVYESVGKEINAKVVPCGIAWSMALKEHPEWKLHWDDNSHPNTRGVYLNTCVFYQTLTNCTPLPSSYSFTANNITLSKEQLEFYQSVAKKTCQ